MRRGVVVAAVVGLMGLCSSAPAGAQGLAGTAVMAAKQKVSVKRCGKDRGTSGLVFTVDASGAWTAETDEAVTFTGTAAPFGASGRKLDLTFDAESLAAFVGALASDASNLCGAAVVADTVERTLFRFGVNRRGTKAALALKYKLTGSAGGQPGTATFKLKAKGPFTGP
jgi:hypothetical protein